MPPVQVKKQFDTWWNMLGDAGKAVADSIDAIVHPAEREQVS